MVDYPSLSGGISAGRWIGFHLPACLPCLVLASLARTRPAQPRLALPASPRLARSRQAMPRPALPAEPGLAMPAMPRRALSRRVAPRHACHAKPSLAMPRRAMRFLAQPSRAYLPDRESIIRSGKPSKLLSTGTLGSISTCCVACQSPRSINIPLAPHCSAGRMSN